MWKWVGLGVLAACGAGGKDIPRAATVPTVDSRRTDSTTAANSDADTSAGQTASDQETAPFDLGPTEQGRARSDNAKQDREATVDTTQSEAPMSTPLLPRGWTDLSLETNVVSRLFTSRSCTHDGKFKNCTTCRDRQLAFPCIEVSFADGQLVGVSFELSKQWTGDDASRELAEDWGSPTGRLSSPVSAVCWDTHDTKADLVMRGKEAGRKAGTMVLLIRQGVAGICPAPAARASVIKTRAIPKGNAEYIDAKEYPAEARAHSIEGLIRVRLVVDSSGVVTSATLLTHLGYGLDELALKYAARIRFEPAKGTDDKPVTSVVVWTFHMSLPR